MSCHYFAAPFAGEVKSTLSSEKGDENAEDFTLESPKFLAEAKQRVAAAAAAKSLPTLLASWPELTWVIRQWVPTLISLVTSLDMVDADVAKGIYRLIKGITDGFSLPFAEQEIRPLLQEVLDNGNHLEGEEDEARKKSMFGG